MNRVRCLLLAGLIAVGLVAPAFAQQQANQPASTPPLVQLLQSKGILTSDEAAMISQASSADEANARLAQLLYSKGVISKQDYDQMLVPSMVQTGAVSEPHLVNAVIRVAPKAPPTIAPASDFGTEPGFRYGEVPAETGVIPAVAPVRVLPIDIPKQGGLIPDIKLGSGANLKIYGFFKATTTWDSASSGGGSFGANDFPLPLFIGGPTGPTADPQVHIKARSFRIGSLFEWVPKGSDLVITGRVEMDNEGDFTTQNSVNVSSVRNPQVRMRLAYVRLDTKIADLPVYAEFGQDWTLLASSTLMNILETTQAGAFFGDTYERAPQFKVGAQFAHGDFKFEPDLAIQLTSSGDSTLTADQRTRFGDRAGPESDQPAVEGRLVFQFPLNRNWQGVAPAQLIVSGHHARINEIIPGQALTLASSQLPPIGLPNTPLPSGATCANGGKTIFACFPEGLQFGFPQNIFTVEAQLPTPWVTVVAKWYKGSDLRFFFGGQTEAAFTNPGPGLVPAGATTALATGNSFSGTSILFGCPPPTVAGLVCGGNVVPGILAPIRGQGGFTQVSFPLSRIFHADPEGHNAGWILAFTYGTDRAKRSDAAGTTSAVRLGVPQVGGNGLIRTDMVVGTLSYKVNKWVSFVNEVTWYQTQTGWQFTNAAGASEAIKKPFAGENVTTAHDWRNEFGTIVTF